MIWKEELVSWFGVLNQAFARSDREKSRKRHSGLQPDIWTLDFWNTKNECNPLTGEVLDDSHIM
jgi:hypothetical protein